MDVVVGNIYGRWKVVAYDSKRVGGHYWTCLCECGVQKPVRAYYLTSGKSLGCGCRNIKTPLLNSSIEDKENFIKSKASYNNDTGCWEWTGGATRGGYGTLLYHGGRWRAHRLSYHLLVGEIGELFVLHRCDNPCCVNPDHLFLGTQQENMEDMHIKNRAPKSNPKIAGENNVNSKLKDSDIIEIRRLVQLGHTKAHVGRLYNLRDSYICKIVQRNIWAHVD